MSKRKLPFLRDDLHLNEVVRGSAWAFGTKGAAMLAGYGFIWLISNRFGPEVVGRYSLSLSIVSIISLVSLLGFPTAILRFTGEFSSDRAAVTILRNMIILGLVLSIVLAFAATLASELISVSIFHDPGMKRFLVIMLWSVPFIVGSRVLIEFLRGYRMIRVSEMLRSSEFFFKLLLAVAFLFLLQTGPFLPAVAHTGAVIIMLLLVLAVTVRQISRLQFEKETRVPFGRILTVSLPMLATESMFLVMAFTDRIMLGIMATTFDVGIYSVSLRLAVITSVALISVNTIVAPKFSELYWSNRMYDLRRVVRFSARIVFYLSAPVLIIYMVFPHQVLALFGPEFVQGSAALMILSAGRLVNSACGSVGHFMNMTGHQNAFRNIVMGAAGLNVLLNYVLIPKYGVNGAAIATATSMVAWNVVSLAHVKKKAGLYVGYLPFAKS